jgi:Arc/MetJ-type ribon-helix-helix transcriptional regulator
MSIITVRVPKKMKEKLERYNVNVSETVRRLLDEYLAELEAKGLAERLELLRKRLGGKISPEQVVKLVREDRESR